MDAGPRRILAAIGHGSPDWFHDETHLAAAFAAEGMNLTPVDWKDLNPADLDPTRDVVLVRTIWDYTQHPERFARWLDDLERAGIPCVNPPDVMRWNMDKRYLLELEAAGHAIVPTLVLDAYDVAAVAAIAREQGWDEAIAKPVVGGGAEGLVRVRRDGTERALGAAGNTWAPDAPTTPPDACLVQPFLPAIQDGEWSLFFFDGTFSHAIRKLPADGDFRVQEEHGGTTVSATPPPHVRTAAQDLADHDPRALVCRVDGLDVDGRFLVMELELIEPELYFRTTTGGETRLARAVAAALP